MAYISKYSGEEIDANIAINDEWKYFYCFIARQN